MYIGELRILTFISAFISYFVLYMYNVHTCYRLQEIIWVSEFWTLNNTIKTYIPNLNKKFLFIFSLTLNNFSVCNRKTKKNFNVEKIELHIDLHLC